MCSVHCPLRNFVQVRQWSLDMWQPDVSVALLLPHRMLFAVKVMAIWFTVNPFLYKIFIPCGQFSITQSYSCFLWVTLCAGPCAPFTALDIINLCSLLSSTYLVLQFTFPLTPFPSICHEHRVQVVLSHCISHNAFWQPSVDEVVFHVHCICSW